MPRFMKLCGTHARIENDKEVIYRKGDVIEATEKELQRHDATLNTWRALDEIVPEATKPEPEGLKIVKIEGTKEFNVINIATGEPINDIPLSRKEAFDLTKNHQNQDSAE